MLTQLSWREANAAYIRGLEQAAEDARAVLTTDPTALGRLRDAERAIRDAEARSERWERMEVATAGNADMLAWTQGEPIPGPYVSEEVCRHPRGCACGLCDSSGNDFVMVARCWTESVDAITLDDVHNERSLDHLPAKDFSGDDDTYEGDN